VPRPDRDSAAKKKQLHSITPVLHVGQDADVAAACQRRLKTKIPFNLGQLSNSGQQQSGRAHILRFRRKRGQASRDEIGVQEFTAIDKAGQEFRRECRFSGPVWASNQIYGWRPRVCGSARRSPVPCSLSRHARISVLTLLIHPCRRLRRCHSMAQPFRSGYAAAEAFDAGFELLEAVAPGVDLAATRVESGK
jgi:hypothetical protein